METISKNISAEELLDKYLKKKPKESLVGISGDICRCSLGKSKRTSGWKFLKEIPGNIVEEILT